MGDLQMIPKEFLDYFLALLIPAAGAMGYVHGVFATNTRVDGIEKTVSSKVEVLESVVRRVDSVLCEIAIKEQLKDVVKICTKKE